MSSDLESFIRQHKAKVAQEKSDLQQVDCSDYADFFVSVIWHTMLGCLLSSSIQSS